jgi:hypothetical protein
MVTCKEVMMMKKLISGDETSIQCKKRKTFPLANRGVT